MKTNILNFTLGGVVGVIITLYTPYFERNLQRALKAEKELKTIESRGVVLRGLNDRCTDWTMRIDCKDNSEASWDFLYIDKKDNNEKAK